MTKIIGQVELVRVATGKIEIADVLLGLYDRHLDDHEKLWHPMIWSALQSAAHRCKGNEPSFMKEIARLGIEDAQWDWRRLHKSYGHNSQYGFLAVECGGRTQGLMLLEAENRATRLEPKGLGIGYVELLATAPWNRKDLVETPEFRHVGRVLLAAAISFSIEKTLNGRIGLHSVPGAVVFYRKCGMVDLGSDPKKHGFIYFEMSEQLATDFLLHKTITGGGQ